MPSACAWRRAVPCRVVDHLGIALNGRADRQRIRGTDAPGSGQDWGGPSVGVERFNTRAADGRPLRFAVATGVGVIPRHARPHV